MLLASLSVTVSLFLCLGRTTAVPAIVWNKSQPSADAGETSLYVSNEISFEQMLMTECSSSSSITESNNDITVVFLLERDSSTGQELLTSRTPLLQQTLQHSQTPKQYSHVTGMESGANLLKKCKACTATSAMEPVLVTLNELGYKLNQTISSSADTQLMMDVTGDTSATASLLMATPVTKKAAITKRNARIAASKLLVVSVPVDTSVEVLDATVRQTLGVATTVILSSVRSVDEVKYERRLSMQRSLLEKTIVGSAATTTTTPKDPYHRRLEDQGGDNNNNNNNNLSGIYYVQMTPNIFSGLLFFLLFSVVTMIGISCMNMITGQDVYVSTMPSIGREA